MTCTRDPNSRDKDRDADSRRRPWRSLTLISGGGCVATFSFFDVIQLALTVWERLERISLWAGI
jgi:hypothetical protein